MSLLSVCVEQILRPSFLPTYDVPARRKSPAHSAEKRRQVLMCLRLAKRPVGRLFVEDDTGYTRQSVNHILAVLVESGEARRVDGGAVLLWEAV